jgi:hypothetical protein
MSVNEFSSSRALQLIGVDKSMPKAIGLAAFLAASIGVVEAAGSVSTPFPLPSHLPLFSHSTLNTPYGSFNRPDTAPSVKIVADGIHSTAFQRKEQE